MNGEGAIFFHLYFPHVIFELFYFCYFILFVLVSNSN
jgi:hypothetical protein